MTKELILLFYREHKTLEIPSPQALDFHKLSKDNINLELCNKLNSSELSYATVTKIVQLNIDKYRTLGMIAKLGIDSRTQLATIFKSVGRGEYRNKKINRDDAIENMKEQIQQLSKDTKGDMRELKSDLFQIMDNLELRMKELPGVLIEELKSRNIDCDLVDVSITFGQFVYIGVVAKLGKIIGVIVEAIKTKKYDELNAAIMRIANKLYADLLEERIELRAFVENTATIGACASLNIDPRSAAQSKAANEKEIEDLGAKREDWVKMHELSSAVLRCLREKIDRDMDGA